LLVGMAMDAERMSIWYFIAGVAVGTLYFVCLWWNARLFSERGGAWLSILLMLGRIAVLGCLLTLAARQGAMPLLLMALGIFAARFAVMRGLRTAAP
jgi:F1F0 ATPase subunit 2